MEIDSAGRLLETTLGRDVARGESHTHVVKARNGFASYPGPDTEYSFLCCAMTPGFDFQDFELAERRELVGWYPEYAPIIERLTRSRD